MADFTQVKADLWQDPEFEQLTPGAKLLWLNLLTSPTRNTAGLYTMSVSRMAFETGLDREQTMNALAALTALEWVAYDNTTGVVWIRNFIRRQPLSGPTIREKILRDLAGVGMRHPLVRQCLEYYSSLLDAPAIPPIGPIDAPSMASTRKDEEEEEDSTRTRTRTEEENPPSSRARGEESLSLLDFALRELPVSQSAPEDYARTLQRHGLRLARSQIERIVCELAEWEPAKSRDKLHLTLNKWLSKEQPEAARGNGNGRTTAHSGSTAGRIGRADDGVW